MHYWGCIACCKANEEPSSGPLSTAGVIEKNFFLVVGMGVYLTDMTLEDKETREDLIRITKRKEKKNNKMNLYMLYSIPLTPSKITESENSKRNMSDPIFLTRNQRAPLPCRLSLTRTPNPNPFQTQKPA